MKYDNLYGVYEDSLRVSDAGIVYVRDLKGIYGNPDGKVMEHRLIAALMMGRPLKPHEYVHHINHDKTDNTPSNLEVIDRTAPMWVETDTTEFRTKPFEPYNLAECNVLSRQSIVNRLHGNLTADDIDWDAQNGGRNHGKNLNRVRPVGHKRRS